MEAIILTEEQAAALEAVNAVSRRALKPRRLNDGRLILNADVLDDPFFVDRARGWARVLIVDGGLDQPEQTQATDGVSDVGVETGAVAAPVVLAAGIQRVILTEAELG